MLIQIALCSSVMPQRSHCFCIYSKQCFLILQPNSQQCGCLIMASTNSSTCKPHPVQFLTIIFCLYIITTWYAVSVPTMPYRWRAKAAAVSLTSDFALSTLLPVFFS